MGPDEIVVGRSCFHELEHEVMEVLDGADLRELPRLRLTPRATISSQWVQPTTTFWGLMPRWTFSADPRWTNESPRHTSGRIWTGTRSTVRRHDPPLHRIDVGASKTTSIADIDGSCAALAPMALMLLLETPTPTQTVMQLLADSLLAVVFSPNADGLRPRAGFGKQSRLAPSRQMPGNTLLSALGDQYWVLASIASAWHCRHGP